MTEWAFRRLILIGYWRGPGEGSWPDPQDFVDPNWAVQERKLVIRHLRHKGVQVPWHEMGWSTCRFCGARNEVGEFTDGLFLWPEGLAHYLEDHNVRLPQRFVDEVLRPTAQLPDWVMEPKLLSRPDMTVEEEIEMMAQLVDTSWWRSQIGESRNAENPLRSHPHDS